MAHELETYLGAGTEAPAWHKQVFAEGIHLPEGERLTIDRIREVKPCLLEGYRHEPIRHVDTDGTQYDPNGFHVVTRADGKVVGTVSDRYALVQPIDLLEVVEQACPDGLYLSNVQALRNGTTFSATFRAECLDMVKSNSPCKTFVSVMTSFDASRSLGMFLTDIRVVCANTESLAFSTLEDGDSVFTRHTGEALARLKTRIVSQFGLVFSESQKLKEFWTKADATGLSVKQVADFWAEAIPGDSTQAKNRREMLEHLTYRGKGLNPLAPTVGSLVCATTEYASHVRGSQSGKGWSSAESKFLSVLAGSDAKLVSGIRDVATKMFLS